MEVKFLGKVMIGGLYEACLCLLHGLDHLDDSAPDDPFFLYGD